MDTYYFVEKNDKYLDLAKNLIDKQLSFRWEMGLLPMTPNAKMSHLDNLVDFSVSIRRYAELSGNISYLKHSIDLINNTLIHHRGKYGYYDHINIFGKPVDFKINPFPPKYNGLLLKGIINILTIDEKMYENLELHELFNDR